MDPFARSSLPEDAFPVDMSNFAAAASSSMENRQPPKPDPARPPKKKTSTRRRAGSGSGKRRCISTACIACRKRKSKCDGALPSCAACASVYGTECIYDPNSDHRRKGVYREKVDSMKARSSTLQILIEAILNAAEDDVPAIVARIRTCDSLDAVAEHLLNQQQEAEKEAEAAAAGLRPELQDDRGDLTEEGERELARKMGELRMENGNVRFIGGTSHLIYLGEPNDALNEELDTTDYSASDDPITTWTSVTKDPGVIKHLMQLYFNYHYPYFTTLSKTMFWRDYSKGKAGLAGHTGTIYCSSLLVNVMLALGCHFTDIPEACAVPGDSRTKGDHFFAEAKRLIMDNDEFARPRLVTVQALALMSVHEAGCAREAKGWVYSGMSFRMAQDIGLNLEVVGLDKERMTEHEIDARKITFWGCFLFDKCWSNYLGRLPQLPGNSYSISKLDVFPQEDSEPWQHYTDNGFDNKDQQPPQPARTRAAALQLSALCEISSDLLIFFYHPNHLGRSSGKAVELKKLSELHRRLEEWRKQLPQEFEPRDGQLPNVILMHMFFHLQYIHLFRPFLKYHPSSSPLPSHVSPRRICTANAGAISKLARLYKKSWDLRQICNIAVYMLHSACTIHLLNLNMEKTARRDIIHGVRHLEEIAEDWPCARRTLAILSVLARKWKCELPAEAAVVLARADENFGEYNISQVPSPHYQTVPSPASSEKTGAGIAGPRENSPLRQYAQPQQPPEPISIDDRLSMSNPLHNINNLSPSRHVMLDNPSPSAALDGFPNPDWRSHQPPSQIQDIPVSFGAAAQAQPRSRQQQVQQQPLPAPLALNMEGQEWFLDDSARWHQSFETWAGPNSPVYMFNDRVASGTPSSTGSAPQVGIGAQVPAGASMPSNGGSGGGDAPATTTATAAMGGYGFEGLGMSLQDGGWLPGLD